MEKIMKKLLLMFLSGSCIAYSMDYAALKHYARQHSNILKRHVLSQQTVQQKNTILLRSENPVLEIETSRYAPELSSARYGYSITASQRVRTQTYMDALQAKVDADKELQSALVLQQNALYMKSLETHYTEYVYRSKLLQILKKEYRLSDKVTHMAKERYKNGSETKVSYLQAKTETLALKTEISMTKQRIDRLYYQLLAMAGIKKKISLQKRFIHTVSSKTKTTSGPIPGEKILEAKKRQYASQVQMNQSVFQDYDIYAGMEQEPDQTIVRFGISVALPLHHDRSQEQTLAKLKMQQIKFDTAQLSLETEAQKKILTASLKELTVQYHTLKNLQKEQEGLTALLREGYKIAKGSLFELMNAKNRLLQTQKSLLQTQKMINDQKRELRFLQGNHND